MTDVPVQLVIAAFKDEKAADEALKELKRAKWAGLIGIQDAAVIRRDKKNKLHVKETGDWGGGKGAVVGGLVGGAIGLLAGPIGLIGVAGAVIGGLSAKLRDSGFSNERLQKIGEALPPETSAIIAVIEHKWVAEMEKEMQEAGADVITQEISADIATQLEEGREVSYTAVATDDAIAMKREAVGDDRVEIGGLVLTEDGLAFADAVVTEDAVVGERGVITDEGAVVEQFAATDDAAAARIAVSTDEGTVVGGVIATTEEEDEDSSNEEE